MIKLLIIKSGLGFYQGDEFSMETSKATKLIELGIAKEITILKAPQKPLIELQTDNDINITLDNKKPLKSARTTKSVKK
jgi:hypothetical protein